MALQTRIQRVGRPDRVYARSRAERWLKRAELAASAEPAADEVGSRLERADEAGSREQRSSGMIIVTTCTVQAATASGYGWRVRAEDEQTLAQYAACLGGASVLVEHMAGYLAVLEALRWGLGRAVARFVIHCPSAVIVDELCGTRALLDVRLLHVRDEIQRLMNALSVTIAWKPESDPSLLRLCRTTIDAPHSVCTDMPSPFVSSA